MVDLTRLEAAVTDPQYYRGSSLQAIYEAAGAVLDGQDVWWCDSHWSTWLNDDDGCEAAYGGQVKPWRNPCRMVRVRLVKLEDE